MENVVAVKGIYPADLFSDRERRKQLKEAKAQAKHEKKDNAIFDDIRETLIKKVFDVNAKQIQEYNEQLGAFNSHENQPLSERDAVDNSIRVAKGAKGTEKSTARGMRNAAISVGKVALAGALGFGAKEVVSKAIVGAASMVGLTLGAGVAGIISAVLFASVAAIITLHRSRKAQKGNVADTIEKEGAAMEKIQEFLAKVEKFSKEIENDKQMLIQKRKTLGKKEFAKFTEEYLGSKIKFLEEIGVSNIPHELQEELALHGEEVIQSAESKLELSERGA